VRVRTPSIRGALALPPTSRPSRRAAVVAAGVLTLLCLAYLAARETPVFAVRSATVAGAPPGVEAAVRDAVRPAEGESLVALDAGDVERRIEAVPTVRAARVDRAFPNRLEIAVVPERPVAVLRNGDRAWVVGESGRVVAAIRPNARPRLARIRVSLERAPEVGGTLTSVETRAALTVLRAVPRRFPARIVSVHVDSSGAAALVVAPRIEIRLGSIDGLSAKLASAAVVLRSLPDEERAATVYLDVTLPERVVAGAETQLESESLEFAD
jgi:cell division protein FtsQ